MPLHSALSTSMASICWKAKWIKSLISNFQTFLRHQQWVTAHITVVHNHFTSHTFQVSAASSVDVTEAVCIVIVTLEQCWWKWNMGKWWSCDTNKVCFHSTKQIPQSVHDNDSVYLCDSRFRWFLRSQPSPEKWSCRSILPVHYYDAHLHL